MEKYNYREAVCEDIRDWLRWHDEFKADHADEKGVWVRDDNRDEIARELNDLLWVEDSVTGNASGSYTFNRWTAEENLCHNWDLLCDAWEEFGDVPNLRTLGAEGADVVIRCYLLSECIETVLDELIK